MVSRDTLLIAAALGSVASDALADVTLLGMTWNTEHLYTVNGTDGSSELFGDFRPYLDHYMIGIDFGPDGLLYGVGIDQTTWGPSLFRFDLAARTAEEIYVDNPGGTGEGDIAFDPDSGLLYMIGVTQSVSNLVTIDIASGHVEPIGEVAVEDYSAMAFDGQGRLWAVDTYNGGLVEFDKHTGDILGEYAFRAGGGVAGMDWDDATQRLYLVRGTGSAPLETYDPETGLWEYIGNVRPGNLAGLAVVPVPSPSAWSAMCLSMLLASRRYRARRID